MKVTDIVNQDNIDSMDFDTIMEQVGESGDRSIGFSTVAPDKTLLTRLLNSDDIDNILFLEVESVELNDVLHRDSLLDYSRGSQNGKKSLTFNRCNIKNFNLTNVERNAVFSGLNIAGCHFDKFHARNITAYKMLINSAECDEFKVSSSNFSSVKCDNLTANELFMLDTNINNMAVSGLTVHWGIHATGLFINNSTITDPITVDNGCEINIHRSDLLNHRNDFYSGETNQYNSFINRM